MAANSTLMFSGFNPNSRNSSKVLRPPGGGSSDIFGLREETKDCRTVEESTTLAEVSNGSNEIAAEVIEESPVEKTTPDESTKPPTESSTTPLPETGESIQPPAEEVSTKHPVESSTTPPPEIVENIQPRPDVSTKPPVDSSTTPSAPSLPPPVAGVRGRVPPGGHSSGAFW